MSLEALGIEFVMLTDHAEVVNGKLYMMGGGYDRRIINNLDAPATLSMVVSVLVPWNLSNQSHTVKLRIETEDGMAVGQEVQGSLMVGHGIEVISGQVFRVMAVVNCTLPLPKLGGYRVTASLPSGESKTTTFYAISAETTAQPAG